MKNLIASIIAVFALVAFLALSGCSKEEGYHSSSWGHYMATFENNLSKKIWVKLSTIPQCSGTSLNPGDSWTFVETETKHGAFGSPFLVYGELTTDTILSGILEPKIYTISD